jgi:lipopolysaccharide/colanic/teichoic acid biosynthesis glycosyltransferase
MVSIVTVRSDKGNVADQEIRPLWKEQAVVSAPPLEPTAASARRGRFPRRSVQPSASLAKRAFDIVVASATLLLLAPLLIAVAIAIKVTSPGPVLVFQYSYGYLIRPFKIYKFRSMRMDAGDTPGDAGMTLIGELLRRVGLEEMPQLVNVVRGDMSLVGPRPRLAAEPPHEDLAPYYLQLHAARPGITGPAQLSGGWGGTIEPNRAISISRIDYDLDYIEKWSLCVDMMIIARAIRREFLSGSSFQDSRQ